MPEPGDDETEAALRSVLRRSRRQVRTRAVVGVAAATATAVGTVALVQRGGDPTSDAVVAGSGDPSGDTGPSDGWPWTTSRSASAAASTRRASRPVLRAGMCHPRSRPGGDDVVGNTMRAFTLEARLTTVPAGGTAEIAGVVIGTASCQIDGPPGIAPGDYEAVVQVQLAVDPVGPGGNPALIVRAPLTVIPRQR